MHGTGACYHALPGLEEEHCAFRLEESHYDCAEFFGVVFGVVGFVGDCAEVEGDVHVHCCG